ncbi:unnamed protein product [Lactuca virosa]|uniref:Uncharacterized protein n=1 Tax=Lactuca virosa TaxID=75947 RepID=A0AAU9N1Z3_9ASTR|nr:unnamed protein product [Lactuca virosa]
MLQVFSIKMKFVEIVAISVGSEMSSQQHSRTMEKLSEDALSNIFIWLFPKYGVPESWVKHQAFSQFSGDILPYEFTSQNEFLFESKDSSAYVVSVVCAFMSLWYVCSTNSLSLNLQI